MQWVDSYHKKNQMEYWMLDNNNIGYTFNIDLHYPKKLHDLYHIYPLAPEKIKLL